MTDAMRRRMLAIGNAIVPEGDGMPLPSITSDGVEVAKEVVAEHTARLQREAKARKDGRSLQRLLTDKAKPKAAPGEVKRADAKGFGRRLSKLAASVPAVVRSMAQHAMICRKAGKALPMLAKAYGECSGDSAPGRKRRAMIALAMRKLAVPMFGITMPDGDNGYTVFVSANVLSDYWRERIPYEVIAFPVVQRHGRIASVRKVEAELDYVEAYASSRANRHAVGIAQNAVRYCRLENDGSEIAIAALEAAEAWLVEGTMKYLMPKASYSTSDGFERMLALLCENDYSDKRSNFHGSREPHKMRQPTREELVFAFRSWK